MAESLPNITGWFHIVGNGLQQSFISVTDAHGCFRADHTTTLTDGHTVNTNENTAWNPYFSASRSSAAYQDNAKVRPNSVVTHFFIKF